MSLKFRLTLIAAVMVAPRYAAMIAATMALFEANASPPPMIDEPT